MPERDQPQDTDRVQCTSGTHLEAPEPGRAGSHPTRWPGFVITLLIGLLVASLVLPVSPFVRAGGNQGSATPEASPVAVEVPADRYWVTFQPCTAVPRDYDETMTVIARAVLGPEPPSFSLGFAPEIHDEIGGPVTSYQLPDGPVPSPSSVDAVVQLLGADANCNSILQALAYFTDAYVIRGALDDEQGGISLAALWRSANPVDTPVPSYPEPITDGNGSEIQAPAPPQVPTPPDRTGERGNQLYGFRMIDDTHLGAYVEIGDNVSDQNFDPIQPTFEQTGYVVFEQQPDGTWLIDAYESPDTIFRQRLFPEGEATPTV